MVRVDGNGSAGSLIQVRGLDKTYRRGNEDIDVLQGLNLDVDKGDFVAFMGPSGSGKTTLLNLMGGLDVPTRGTISVAGDEITHMSRGKLTDWRARHVGFIFQMYNLIPVLTAFQNVELPLLLTKLSKAERRRHVETALAIVGLGERMSHFPRQLSGGQEQRVAIARAIVADPTFLLCDEPTGDLDRKSADEVMGLIKRLVKEYGKTVLMVTHDPVVANLATYHAASRKGRAGRSRRAARRCCRRRLMKFSRLILANLFRKKARLVLTIGSFAVALFLFALLGVVNDAFSRGADVVSANRLVTINRTSIINTIPLSYRDEILRIPGVKYITHENWFGGVYQDPKNFFPQFVIDPENQRQVFPELIVPDDQWNAFLKDRQGAIVGAATMKRFGWKIGDRIPLKTTIYGLAGKALEFNVDGVYNGAKPEDDETQFWIQWEYFKESVPDSVKGQVGWYTILIDNPDDAPRIAKAIDNSYLNSPYETKTETESAFAEGWVKQFGNIKFLIISIGTVVFFTLLLVTGNTMAISVRERTNELGVLKAIGFPDRLVLGFILGESMVIALAGCVGLLLALIAIPVLSRSMAGLLPPLMITAKTLVYGVIAALLVGFASGILPAYSAMRMGVVTALRRV